MPYEFGFEKTDAYRLMVEVARWMRAQNWPTGTAHLKDQGTRAADSAVLNLAEGYTRRGRAGNNQLRIAQASAAEVLAVLDVMDLPGSAKQQQKLRRVAAMLQKMQR
ncbi:MAG: four helix bundle protein [Proteobacteria bacterium]|jgi:four helix bundle protein|nr:four helix bundle protein [Pseudomonadota bacterium]